MGRTVPAFFLGEILRLGGAVTMPRFGVEGCALFFWRRGGGVWGKSRRLCWLETPFYVVKGLSWVM